jgi:hypothetical protein
VVSRIVIATPPVPSASSKDALLTVPRKASLLTKNLDVMSKYAFTGSTKGSRAEAHREKENVMKVMVMVKGTPADEATAVPTTEMFEAMAAYNERLVKAGIMLDGAGLKPSSTGAKVVFEGGTTSVVDGPFTEAKEIIGGYWIWQVNSLEEAVEWARQCPTDPEGRYGELEIRPYGEEDDFGDAMTPELREKEAQLAAELRARRGEA